MPSIGIDSDLDIGAVVAALGPVVDADLGVPANILGDGLGGLDDLSERPGGLRAVDMDTLVVLRMLQALTIISCLLYIAHYLLGLSPLDGFIIR